MSHNKINLLKINPFRYYKHFRYTYENFSLKKLYNPVTSPKSTLLLNNYAAIHLGRHDIIIKTLESHSFVHLSFKQRFINYHVLSNVLAFNFSRGKFFPTLRTIEGESYLFLSLGLFLKFFTKSRNFIKSKTMYLLLISFIRKTLIFIKTRSLLFVVTKTPLYLKEMMTTLHTPVVNVYANPFGANQIEEAKINTAFSFPYLIFINNKNYGTHKLKKKGRLKRKITKRLVKNNYVTDL